MCIFSLHCLDNTLQFKTFLGEKSPYKIYPFCFFSIYVSYICKIYFIFSPNNIKHCKLNLL